MTMSKITRTTVEGKVSRDVEVRDTRSGRVANVSVPHQRSRMNKDTNQWENVGETTWYEAAFWNEDADTVAGLVGKGTLVLLTGDLEVEPYLKQDGSAGARAKLNFPTIAVVPPKAQQRPQGPPYGGQPQQQASGDVWGAPGASYNDETPF